MKTNLLKLSAGALLTASLFEAGQIARRTKSSGASKCGTRELDG